MQKLILVFITTYNVDALYVNGSLFTHGKDGRKVLTSFLLLAFSHPKVAELQFSEKYLDVDEDDMAKYGGRFPKNLIDLKEYYD